MLHGRYFTESLTQAYHKHYYGRLVWLWSCRWEIIWIDIYIIYPAALQHSSTYLPWSSQCVAGVGWLKGLTTPPPQLRCSLKYWVRITLFASRKIASILLGVRILDHHDGYLGSSGLGTLILGPNPDYVPGRVYLIMSQVTNHTEVCVLVTCLCLCSVLELPWSADQYEFISRD